MCHQAWQGRRQPQPVASVDVQQFSVYFHVQLIIFCTLSTRYFATHFMVLAFTAVVRLLSTSFNEGFPVDQGL